MASDIALKMVPAQGSIAVSQQEAEALLRKEGFESFCWYDVPGSTYPHHSHPCDECLWLLKGQLTITVGEQAYALRPGDRLYLPKGVAHTAEVPKPASATYLIGQRG